MIFGNKNDFAIEAIVEPGLVPPSSLWGRMCVWVQGEAIGDFGDPHCGLCPAYDGFNEICENLNSLWLPEFVSLNDRQIWNFLDGLLYSYHGDVEIDDTRSLEQMQDDWQKYGEFNFLTNWGEMFDRGGKSFLLKLPSGDLKVLNFDLSFEKNVSLECTEFNFRKAVQGFKVWLEEQEKLLSIENA